MGQQYNRANDELISDDGNDILRLNRVSIRADLKGVRRTVSNGPSLISLADDDAEIVTFAAINGTMDLAPWLRVVNGDGTLVVWGEPVLVSILPDQGREDGLGIVTCHPRPFGKDKPVEEIIVSVNLPKERFDWLWGAIGELRDAVVTVDFRTTAWQRDIEAHFDSSEAIPHFTLDRNLIQKVHAVALYINEEAKAEPAFVENDKGELVPKPSFVLDPRIVRYLGWIIGLQALLIIVTMFQR